MKLKTVIYCSILAVTLSFSANGQALADVGSESRTDQIVMHVDKTSYMPGEIVWFKAYNVTRSHVAYVELIGPDQKSVLRAKIALGSEHSNSGSLYLPANLSSGEYNLLAYTAAMKGVGVHVFYNQKIAVLNPYLPVDDNVVTASLLFMDHQVYFPKEGLDIDATIKEAVVGHRQKVNLSVSTSENGLTAPSDLSISVFKVDEWQPEPKDSAIPIPYVESKVRNEIDADMLLEQRYHQVAFRMNDRSTKQPLVNRDVFLSVPGKQTRLYTGTTDAEGKVRFYVKEIFGINPMAIRLEDGSESDVELISPFYSGYNQFDVSGVQANDVSYNQEQREIITERSMNVQAENSYFAKERAEFIVPRIDSLPFFGESARVYHLDDYTRFVLMEEVLREYVTEVRLTKRGSNYRFRVLDNGYGQFFNESPLIMIDGVPISSEDDIIAFDPLKIEKISIITRRYYLGNNVYEGVINFSTYDGDLAGFPLDNSITLIDYEGFQLDRQFFSPIHDGNEKRWERMPDTRNLLYWNSSVKVGQDTAANLSFYTSDVEGDYVVVINGQSESGKLGSTVLKFSVRE